MKGTSTQVKPTPSTTPTPMPVAQNVTPNTPIIVKQKANALKDLHKNENVQKDVQGRMTAAEESLQKEADDQKAAEEAEAARIAEEEAAE